MEVTQFTYFQQVGGLACDPVAVEVLIQLLGVLLMLHHQEDQQMEDMVKIQID